MKRHIKTIVLSLLLLALLPGTVLAAGAALPDYYRDSCYAELSLMYRRLANTEGPNLVVVGGSAETGYFTFESIEDQNGGTLGYLISGLAGSGLARAEPTAPAAYDGLPVVGFTQDALAGAASLEQLRLPESIESLPDGLFGGCPALTQLILEHRSRPCSVTEHTFDGAGQVKVFVPSEVCSMYRDGVGCETNPWASYLDRVYPFQ